MVFRDRVYTYIIIAGMCLLSLLLLVGFDHLSYDRSHFAQQIENAIQEQETEAVHQLREGDWISQLRSTQKTDRILSNDLVRRIEELCRIARCRQRRRIDRGAASAFECRAATVAGQDGA